MLIGLSKSEVQLINWNIIQLSLPSGESGEFFIGYSLKDSLARFSTPIVEYDEIKRLGRTRSGSTYQLLGQPSHPCKDGMHVLYELFGKEHIQKELFSLEASGVLSFKYPINKKP
ncbi:hypothetical protein [Methylophaga pinxianii]|uniref:hypothetical protein n=1 Tax=Methylophaga pinxianii TaxID=2881052 RepID=UPI001CF2AC89|nr:hypothetical protein [Methylophaga pinxianii]MCB2427674.1 hypothetical protein [Methylophaga pinxianii]UPH46177.1 hypothetical protein LGT42_002530 [Methylophaga pinxianii]